MAPIYDLRGRNNFSEPKNTFETLFSLPEEISRPQFSFCFFYLLFLMSDKKTKSLVYHKGYLPCFSGKSNFLPHFAVPVFLKYATAHKRVVRESKRCNLRLYNEKLQGVPYFKYTPLHGPDQKG